jgi:general secretion pathway protein G
MFTVVRWINQAMETITVTGKKISLRRRSIIPGRKSLSQKGFTLIELLIVLVILSLLAALVGPALVERLKPAKRTAAQSQIEEFMSALDTYYVDVGRYPSTEEGLEALRVKPSAAVKWDGPYLKKDIPDDPWGNPYIYRSPGRNGGYEIISYGADGKEGGEGEGADVNSWETGSSKTQK